MDNGDSGPGAQWMAPDLHDKMQKSRRFVLSFDGARRENGLGAAAWILWLQDEFGIFEKVSYGGRVLRNASAMIAEREALRMGIEHLTVLFPTEVSSFDFQVECTGRTVQYKLNAQSLRLFGLHRDVNDAHRASANRLQNKNKIHTYIQWGSVLRAARNTTPACSSLCVSQPCLPFSVVRRQGSTAVCGPSCLVVPSVRTLRRLDEVSPHAFFLSSFFFFASTRTLDIACCVQLGTDFFDHFIVMYQKIQTVLRRHCGVLLDGILIEVLGCLDTVCRGMNDRHHD